MQAPDGIRIPISKPGGRRRLRSVSDDWRAWLMAICLTALTGCAVGREFRDAALPSIRSGTLSITTGLLEGLFAAIEVDPQTTQSGSSSRR